MKITITGVTAEGKTTLSLLIAEALTNAGLQVSNTDEDAINARRYNRLINDRIQLRRLEGLVEKRIPIVIETVQEKKSDVVHGAGCCKVCGTTKDVTHAPDPFMDDLHGDSTPVWMCEGCREDSTRDL